MLGVSENSKFKRVSRLGGGGGIRKSMDKSFS